MKRLLVTSAILALALAACTNDPFDPDTLPNAAPTMRFFAEPVDPEGELSDTSYYERTFFWSGSDQDGWVDAYFVSIRRDPAVPAPWDTTARTDTTMTFVTDAEGRAEVTFLLACRDDRGALSDTLVQRVPMRNFPPELDLQGDFNPLANMQRDFIYEGEAVVDTVYWNWGFMTARLFAFDLDGRETMDDFYRYTTADTDPVEIRPWDDPTADPMLHWIEVPFAGANEIEEFEVRLGGLPAGRRTLTVTVADEADTETRFTYSWDVRAPRGEVLVVADNSGTAAREFYRGFLDDYLGVGGWDEYDFWFGFPDNPTLLLETLRLFNVVFWFDGGGTSTVLVAAAQRDGVLEQFVYPIDGSEGGRLLLISRNLTGAGSGLPHYFRQTVIGVNPAGAPASTLEPEAEAAGLQALGAQPWLPPMTLENLNSRGIGLTPLAGTEELYRFEECELPDGPGGCLGLRPPYDPLIAVRQPQRATSELASTVGVSYQLEAMVQLEAWAALAAIVEFELGVVGP